MPPLPKRPCAKVGCRNTVQGKDRWCKDHTGEQAKYQKAQDKRRGTAAQRGYTWRWAQYSKDYRARHPLCVECERQGRITQTQHVDHIKAVTGPDDPLFWDETNHQSLCRTCHSIKTAKQDGGFGARGSAKPKWLPKPGCPVVLVCGPPGAGKSSWVANNKTQSDVVIDLDCIMSEISSMPIYGAGTEWLGRGLAERNRRLASLERKASGTAWVIITGATIEDRQWWRERLGAGRVVVLAPTMETCLIRINDDSRRGAKTKAHAAVAREWYATSMMKAGEEWIRG